MNLSPASPELIATSLCHVCGSPLPGPLLDLGHQPLCDDLVPIGSTRDTPRYPIQISLCPRCLTAHQRFNLRKEALFRDSYHYRPRFTQDVLQGMARLVEDYVERFGTLAGKRVCDIGCSDGSLLNYARDAGAVTCGIEPTGAAIEALAARHVIIRDFLTVDSARRLVAAAGQPDVVTFTNVFAHIEDLQEAVAALRVLIAPSTRVVIENHYLGSVLDRTQFDTFYHEHPRTYSFRSFEYIARAIGGVIEQVVFPERYGGNIRVVIAGFDRPTGAPQSVVGPDESHFPLEMAAMRDRVEHWRRHTRQALDDLRAAGLTVSGKSFPARASVLINLLGLDSESHPSVFEREGSLKVGHYVPGTRIPIESDEAWISGTRRPEALLIWGWHIAGEIAAYMRACGYGGRIFTPLPVFAEL